ncbi:MAG: 16S rRNA (guanine(527)-N(7))-methyltransferase RsmG [Micrococcales bacterium]|jgi:16S rRNA (guanine527-N7)-methyltransferase|nr:16S rRNA (guanine(527)-N(7))-methyltransferase RsmG [Actinomycetota bacterium]NCA07808.1 16S rRNA (guanine(527)-N(7))-methyltransferase RsmG [Micrococcales bacterium]
MSDNIDEVFSLEQEPTEAAIVFGDQLPLARKYAELLSRDGDLLGLIGPRELPKLWSRHILNSAVVAEFIEDGQTVADVGSGAGLPGIPMAIMKPKASFVLIEPMERRSTWLAETVVPALGLKNVKVLRGRAEEAPLANYDVATARAVSALPKLLRMLTPLVVSGGTILALKGSKASEEITESKPLIKKLKLASFEIVTAGDNVLNEPTTIVRVRLL